ncbi:RNA-binding protein 43 [Salminus brasiliensis]|uniref:RNA-binding protein 43 n=1 Tax=Salminus brasiliensis TaxID=930266 RepID=UPI003B83700B
MNPAVIKVSGIPAIDLDDRMLDQLKIHFQRRSNSGADVLTVLPTSTPDQAYVVFESDNVPGVLQRNHVLEVDSKFYPVHVQRAHQSEVDMPVKTKLNMSMFPKPQDVWLLLRSNGFEATEIRPGILQLKGSFLSLKLLRKKLTELLVQDVLSQNTSPSALSNGYPSASVSQMEPNHLVPITAFRPSSNHGRVMSNGVHAGSRRPMVNAASPLLGVSSASLKLRQPVSPVYGDPGSAGSPSSSPNYSDYTFHNRPSSKPREASLLVDKHVLDYALIYEENFFKEIEVVWGCEMSLKDHEDVTTVTFLGKDCEKAKRKLQSFIENIAPSLRIQEIHLNDYDLNQQVDIRKRVQYYTDIKLGVTIKQDGETVKVVGASTKSFVVKQQLLGESEDPSTSSQRGRQLERNSRQRSSSLPRQYKLNRVCETDQGRLPEPKYGAGVAKEYSPSDYQEEPQSRRARGLSNEQQSRRRSNSESRDRQRETRAKPKLPDEVQLPTSDGEKKSKGKILPSIKKSLGIDMSILKKPKKTSNKL